MARASGQARISAGGVEKDVTVQDADASVLDAVDAAYREKYGTGTPALSRASPMPITARPRSGCCPGHDTPSTPKIAAS
jgi:hypothetical protein